tara:strand:- start:40 stop:1167 length:1128 start_codon:yes stop_codon:yes gene_type:complete
MPSSSKSQQRFFGVVKSMQKGDLPKKGKAGKAAKSMTKKDVDDFASTKHKGLPNKVKRENRVKSLIKKMVREEIQEQMCFDLQTEKCWKGYEKKGTKMMFGKRYPNCVKKEGKIKEDYKNSEWEVYLRDEKGREKIVKVAKSKRAATILYNRIIKSDDYYEVGMRAIKEGKLTEGKFGKFDTGINFRGNGLTVYDRNQSKGGDFKSIAFIANGKVKLYDKDVKKEPKLMKALQNIAKSQLQVEGKLTEAKEPLWDKDSVKNVIKQIQKGIKVPYADGLGLGALSRRDEHPAIIGKISVDDKKTWPNGYLENSRWALVRIEADGTIDTVRMNGYGDFKTRKKVPILRKSKNKSIKQIIDRLGKYFTVVRLKYPDNK